jgi:general secretion pathway protein A
MMEVISSHESKGMFESYFGFRESPFGVTPDPRFFYGNSLYLEGLAALVYGIRAKKGLMLLTGEVGTGKTILLRKLMRQLETSVQFIFISSSHITSYGLVELIIQDLGLAAKEKHRLDMIHELNAYLLEQQRKGQTVTLLVDEGQNLSEDALEGLCTLSNLETDIEKLLQIILVGQPELTSKLSKPPLRRIRQRIAIHHRLYALQSMSEVENYIHHRLHVVGYEGPEIFNKEAIEAIWYYSAGTPRLINIIADNALAMACDTFRKKVSAYMVMKTASALLLERGSEVAKMGIPELGAAKKPPAPKSVTKRTESNDVATKKEDQVRKTFILREIDRQPVLPAATQPDTVSRQFFDYMTRIATAAMGPMAHLVLRDQISALGESRDAFPQIKLRHLIELVSREILNETMRTRFQDLMFEEIDTRKSVRVS